MEEIENLISFIKDEYKIYMSKNFEAIVDFCYSYGTRTNEYEKNISSLSSNLLNIIINELSKKNIKFSYKEYKKSNKVNIIFDDRNYPSSKVKIIVPVYMENEIRVCSTYLSYIIENKINCNIKISKINKNELLVINVFDEKEAKKVIEYYYNNDTLRKDLKNKMLPFIPNTYGLAICSEIFPYNYVDFFNTIICLFFKNIEDENSITIDSIIDFVDDLYKKETKLLKKEMYLIIERSMKVIKNGKHPLEIIDYNAEMNIGSFDPSDYNIKLDENKLLYFENKEKTQLILFGSDEYLNMCYSKYYKNAIEKTPNNLYYTFFKSIFIKILENNFKDTDKYLDFSSINKDIIYQELILMSSAYFAYKKMGFDYDEIYMIIKNVLEKKLNCNIKYESKNFLDKVASKSFKFPFSIEYGNKVVKKFDGTLTTIFDYFRENNVIELIPINTLLDLKDGNVEKADSFLKRIYEIIPKYESIHELIDNEIELIEYID